MVSSVSSKQFGMTASQCPGEYAIKTGGASNHFLLRGIREKHVLGCILAGGLEIPKKKGLGAPIFGPFYHIAQTHKPRPGHEVCTASLNSFDFEFN